MREAAPRRWSGSSSHDAGADRGRRRVHRRRHPPHLPQPRRAGHRAGGQTMNPSTAQLLEVGRGGARRRGRHPPQQQEHHRRRRAGGRRDRPRPCGSCRPRASPRASPRSSPTTPQADADDNAESMGDAAAAVVAGEVTQAVRDSSSDAGPIREGDYLGISRDGIKAVAATVAEAAVGLLDALVADDHEIVTIIEGEGATVGDTRHISEWLEDNRPDVEPRSTTAASRSTRTSSASSEPARRVLAPDSGAIAPKSGARTDDGPVAAHAGRLRRASVDTLKGVGDEEGRGPRRPRASTRCSTCSPTTPAATSTAPAGGHRRPEEGEEAMVLVTVEKRQRPADAQPPDAGRGRRHRRHRRPDASPSSTSRGGSASSSTGTDASSSASSRLTGAAPDDEPRGRPGRRPHRPDRPRLPAVGEGAHLLTWDYRAVDRRGPPPLGARGFADPVPRELPRPSTASSTAPRRSTTSTCPSRMADVAKARRRLVFDELLRIQLALVHRKRELERTTPRHRATHVDGALVRALPRARCPSR